MTSNKKMTCHDGIERADYYLSQMEILIKRRGYWLKEEIGYELGHKLSQDLVPLYDSCASDYRKVMEYFWEIFESY